MINFLLVAVIALCILTMLACVVLYLQQVNYDQWVREFEEKGGIQWPCSVLDGSEIVSHTVMTERRARVR